MGKKSAKKRKGGKRAAPWATEERAQAALRAKYALLGKPEWWWLMDDSLAITAQQLRRQHFAVLDDFLLPADAAALHKELSRAYDAGRLPGTRHEMEGCPRLEPGALAGGKTGTGLTYQMDAVRGDFVAWFNGSEPACQWRMLPTFLQRLDTLVSELAPLVPGLEGAAAMRSNAMATCYPGGGARYVRHCDNTSKVRNGRRLTALLYANPDWRQGDGGELRVFEAQQVELAEDATRDFKIVRDIEPRGGRVVLFFADERVPHEVLPAHAKRFAVTVWFFDKHEKEQASQARPEAADLRAEQERIEREIARFQAQFGKQARIIGAADEEDSDDEVGIAAPETETLGQERLEQQEELEQLKQQLEQQQQQLEQQLEQLEQQKPEHDAANSAAIVEPPRSEEQQPEQQQPEQQLEQQLEQDDGGMWALD